MRDRHVLLVRPELRLATSIKGGKIGQSHGDVVCIVCLYRAILSAPMDVQKSAQCPTSSRFELREDRDDDRARDCNDKRHHFCEFAVFVNTERRLVSGVRVPIRSAANGGMTK